MSIVGDIAGDIFGSSGSDAAEEAAQIQAASSQAALDELIRGKEEGLGFLAPFGALGQQGLDQAGILTDPQQQFSFLQNNPLFELALDNANRNTNQTAAAGGRLSAGDTLQQLSNNVLLQSQPLLTNQQQNVSNLLGLGTNLAQTQANTALGVGSQAGAFQQDIGNSLSAGVIGAQNAQAQGTQNLLNIGGTLAGLIF